MYRVEKHDILITENIRFQDNFLLIKPEKVYKFLLENTVFERKIAQEIGKISEFFVGSVVKKIPVSDIQIPEVARYLNKKFVYVLEMERINISGLEFYSMMNTELLRNIYIFQMTWALISARKKWKKFSHGDLKPHNILGKFIGKNTFVKYKYNKFVFDVPDVIEIKIIDFGISRKTSVCYNDLLYFFDAIDVLKPSFLNGEKFRDIFKKLLLSKDPINIGRKNNDDDIYGRLSEIKILSYKEILTKYFIEIFPENKLNEISKTVIW